MNLTERQKEKLQKLRVWYCVNLAEDHIDGSNLDCAVLDLLEESVVESQMNKSLYRGLGVLNYLSSDNVE